MCSFTPSTVSLSPSIFSIFSAYPRSLASQTLGTMATRILSYAKKSAVTTTTPSTRSYYQSRTAVQIPDPPLLSCVCPSGTSPPGQVQCFCGDEASGKSTVECVSCSSWSHIQCARLTLRTAKQSRFLCHKCRPATGKRAGAAGGKKCQGDTAHLLAPPRTPSPLPPVIIQRTPRSSYFTSYMFSNACSVLPTLTSPALSSSTPPTIPTTTLSATLNGTFSAYLITIL